MFVVIAIIMPANRTGNLSIILPKIQKIVLIISTASIISGFILFGINTDYQYYKLFFTFWGNIILIPGILSLIVYYNIISGSKINTIVIKLIKSPKLANQIPMVLFFMISVTLISMILISKAFIIR